MQTTIAPPAPPAPPAPLPAQTAAGTGAASPAPVFAVPRTAAEVRALRARREEISNQLTSAADRRENLAEAMQTATGANRAGLEQRMMLLDRRILQLESELEETGQQLRAAPVALQGTGAGGATIAMSREPENFAGLSSGQVTGMSIVFTIFVLMPLAVGMARLMWKRASAPLRTIAAQDAAAAQRLERMEQGMESIAIEVERVSEAQRFLTRILTEGRTPALGVGERPAEPVRVPQGEAMRVPARES